MHIIDDKDREILRKIDMSEEKLAEMRKKVDYIERRFDLSEVVHCDDGRPICPDCVDHPQPAYGDMTAAHNDIVDDVLDCKNLFINDDGSIYGQCCCWSIVHGMRD